MIFQCTRCQKYFDNKTHYNKHLARKLPCKENNNKILDHDINPKLEESRLSIESVKTHLSDKNILISYLSDDYNIQNNKEETNNVYIINSKKNGFKCSICNKIYKHSQSLYNHKKQNHPNYDEDIQKINNIQTEKIEIEKFKELFLKKQDYYEKQLNALNEKNKELELLVKTSKTKNITNNTKNITNNTNNTNNGTINNINIVQFGREDSSLLNKEEISKILYERGIDGLLASIEVFHFNNRLPQYKNIRLTNLKSKYIDIHDGNKWKKENQEKILNETLENHIYHLQTICDEKGNPKKIKNSVKNIIKDYLEVNKFDTEEKKITNNKKTIKKVSDKKEEVKLFVYNNSKLEEDNILMDV